jgi:peptide/nickel transport system substrate-binding protein
MNAMGKAVDRLRGRWGLASTLAVFALATGLLLLSLSEQNTLAQEDSLEPGSLDLSRARLAVSPTILPYATLVDVQTVEPLTLDPHWMYDTASAGVAMQVYEALLTYHGDDPNVLVPQLAIQWELSADTTDFTFTIRPGVSFHAGGSLEAHDVAYSFWRGLIQDRTGGPMWMWFDALFENAYSIEDLAGDDLAKCQAVKEAITFDDLQQTVTFHLAQPLGVFLDLLTISSASILDQEWMVANGEWGGSCADWRNYHDPAVGASALYDQMNGTGPFRFDHGTAGEIRLVRHDGYWRGEPAWPEGPSGPAVLESVLLKYVLDAAARRDMLLQGETDLADIAAGDFAVLDPWVWGMYNGFEDRDPTLLSPTGTLRLFRDLPAMSQTPALMNQGINPDDNPYIGSGALDGNGIPPDFFADIHVRKAFNYAMDWPALIAEALAGEGLQAKGPIPQGMLGYNSAQPTYSHDPTLSAQEFQQAWGGAVWTEGFSLTIPYNTGNTVRQRAAEILAQNLASINPDFHVAVIGMPWGDMLADRRAGRLPIYIGGWLEDYHHPHNWVHPFLHSQGAYAIGQNFPPALAAQFDAKIEECVVLTDPAAAQACYEEIQNMSYTNAVAMWGYQPLARRYMRTEVRGYCWNPATGYIPLYYGLSKGPPPSTGTVDPAVSSNLVFADTAGATITLDVPAGAVSETSTIVYTPDTAVAQSHPGGFRLGGMTFDLQVCQGGECLEDYVFGQTVNITLQYRDEDVARLIEDELYLYTWDGTAWVDVVTDCGWPLTAYKRHPEINELVVPMCHFSRFALVGGTHNVYLPVVLRSAP